MPEGEKRGTIYWDILANAGGLSRGLKQAQGAIGQFLGVIGKAKVIGAASFAVIGIAAIKAAKRSVAAFAVLDSAIREVATLLPATREGLAGVEEALISLSTRVPAPPALLAQATYQAVSAGLTDTGDALLVVEQAAKAAAAGLSDAFTAVDAITTVLNAYQLSADRSARVSDVFFKTIEQGKLRFEDIAANIGNVATSAALGGVSIEELGASLATLTKFGINAAEASTSLNRAILSIINPTKQQQEAAAKYGVELSASALEAKGFTGILRELEEATAGNVEALGELFPNIRAARSVFILAGNGADEYRRILSEVEDAQGATAAALADVSGALDFQRTLLKNNINALWTRLGREILPPILAIVEKINVAFETQNETLLRLAETTGSLKTVEAARLAVTKEQLDAEIQRLKIEATRARTSGIGSLLGEVVGFELGAPRATLDPELLRVFDNLRKFTYDVNGNIEEQQEILEGLIRDAQEYFNTWSGTERLTTEAAIALSRLIGEQQRFVTVGEALLKAQERRVELDEQETEAYRNLLDIRDELAERAELGLDADSERTRELKEAEKVNERILAIEKVKRQIERAKAKDARLALIDSEEEARLAVDALQAAAEGGDLLAERIQESGKAAAEAARDYGDALLGTAERSAVTDSLQAERAAIEDNAATAERAASEQIEWINRVINALRERAEAEATAAGSGIAEAEEQNLRIVQETARIRAESAEDARDALDDEAAARERLTDAERAFVAELERSQDRVGNLRQLEEERAAIERNTEAQVAATDKELDAKQRLLTFTQSLENADQELLDTIEEQARALIRQRNEQIAAGNAAVAAIDAQIAAAKQGAGVDLASETAAFSDALQEQIDLIRERAEAQRAASDRVQTYLEDEIDKYRELLEAELARGADEASVDIIRARIAALEQEIADRERAAQIALDALAEQEAGLRRLQHIDAEGYGFATAFAELGDIADNTVSAIDQISAAQDELAQAQERSASAIRRAESDIAKAIEGRADEIGETIALYEQARDIIGEIQQAQSDLVSGVADPAATQRDIAALEERRDAILELARARQASAEEELAAIDRAIGEEQRKATLGKQLDADRLDRLQKSREELKDEIELLKEFGQVAPDNIGAAIESAEELANLYARLNELTADFNKTALEGARALRAEQGVAPTREDILLTITGGVTEQEVRSFVKGFKGDLAGLKEATDKYRESLDKQKLSAEQAQIAWYRLWEITREFVEIYNESAPLPPLFEADLSLEERLAKARDELNAINISTQSFGFTALQVGDILKQYNVTLEQLGDGYRIAFGGYVDLPEILDNATTAIREQRDALQGLVEELALLPGGLVVIAALANEYSRIGDILASIDLPALQLEENLRRLLQDYIDKIGEIESMMQQGLQELQPPEGGEKAQRQYDEAYRLQQLRVELEAINRLYEQGGLQALAVEDALARWGGNIEDLREPLRRIIESMRNVGEETEDTGTSLEDVLDRVSQIGNAALSLAQAFGVANSEVVALGRSLDQIVQAAKSFASGDYLGGALSGFAGLVGLGATLFGESAEEREAREAAQRSREQNTLALRRLNTELGALRDAFGSFGGELAVGLTAAAEGFNRAWGEFRAFLSGDRSTFQPGDKSLVDLSRGVGIARREFISDLEALGYNVSNLDELFGEFGLSGENVLRYLRGEEVRISAVNRELAALAEALAQLNFQEYFEGFTGQLDLASIRREFADEDSRAAELRDLTRVLLDFTDLPDDVRKAIEDVDWDNVTAEQLSNLEGVLGDFFEELIANPELLSTLGDLTPDELISVFRDLGSGIDDLQDEIGDAADEGAFQLASQENRITREQADKLIGLTSTSVFYLSQISKNTEDLLARFPVTAPSAEEMQNFSGQVAGDVTFNLTFNVDAENGDEMAIQAVARIETEIDKRLGLKLTNSQSTYGLSPKRYH